MSLLNLLYDGSVSATNFSLVSRFEGTSEAFLPRGPAHLYPFFGPVSTLSRPTEDKMGDPRRCMLPSCAESPGLESVEAFVQAPSCRCMAWPTSALNTQPEVHVNRPESWRLAANNGVMPTTAATATATASLPLPPTWHYYRQLCRGVRSSSLVLPPPACQQLT